MNKIIIIIIMCMDKYFIINTIIFQNILFLFQGEQEFSIMKCLDENFT